MSEDASRNARAVSALFRAWSRFYDLHLPQILFYRRIHRRLLARWRPRPGERALDVGCGTGLLLEELLHPGIALSLTGLDLSRPMLAQARRNAGATVPLVQGSVYHLPFASGSFDVALNTISSHFYLDQVAAFGEIRRVLAPGGRFFCAALTSPLGRSIKVGPAVYHPPPSLARHLRDAGFTVAAAERLLPGTTLFEAHVVAPRVP
jgi:ubiquinone/menaquinone biosynthesis C-methylase UbiE